MSCGLRAPRGRSESKRVLDMRGVGWIQGESSAQPVGDGVEPYVKVSPDGIVRATEDAIGIQSDWELWQLV